MRTVLCASAAISLLAVPAGPAAAQDFSFLQPAFNIAAELAEEWSKVDFGPRFVDAASIQAAFRTAGLAVPASSELRREFDLPDPHQIVVDTIMDAVDVGSPDDPRLRAINARRTQTILARVDEWPQQVRWIKDDGMILRVLRISPWHDQDAYTIRLVALVTGGKYVSGVSLGGQHLTVTVITRDGEWVVRGADPG